MEMTVVKIGSEVDGRRRRSTEPVIVCMRIDEGGSAEQEWPAVAESGMEMHRAAIVEQQPECDEPIDVPLDMAVVDPGSAGDLPPVQPGCPVLPDRLEVGPLSGRQVTYDFGDELGIRVRPLPRVQRGGAASSGFGDRGIRPLSLIRCACCTSARPSRPVAAFGAAAPILFARRAARPGQRCRSAATTHPSCRKRLDQLLEVTM